MKTYRANTGPFAERPFYEQSEIEDMCVQELRKQNLYPAASGPIRIDRFVEKRFQLQPSYDDLPPGLLGFTVFGPKGVQEIVVSKALDAEGTAVAERRIRTTLAHEAGHGLLHAHLFALASDTKKLFGDGVSDDGTKILCRGEAEADGSPKRRSSKWWEYQANRVMGALLLPKPLVDAALAPLHVSQGKLGVPVLPEARAEEAARLLAEVFDVNPVVGRLRLKDLSTVCDSRQLTL
jgi:hypothetical protein